MKQLRYFIIGLCIVIFILGIVVEYFAFSNNFYYSEFEKLDVYSSSDLGEEGVIIAADGIIEYLKNNRDDLNIEYQGMQIFNERETDHMKDVKQLFSIIHYLKFFAGFLAIFLFLSDKKKKTLLMGIIYSGIISIGLIGTLAIGVISDFNGIFIKFHNVFFNNDLWILNPKTDRLIQMLPEKFFLDMATVIIVAFISVIATIIVIVLANYRKVLTKS